MFKWFDDWFYNKCIDAFEEQQSLEEQAMSYNSPIKSRVRRPRQSQIPHPTASQYGSSIPKISQGTSGPSLSAEGTTFNLYNANGGYVVELRSYDHSHDRWHNSLHVIPTGEEFGKSLEHIITLEALKK